MIVRGEDDSTPANPTTPTPVASRWDYFYVVSCETGTLSWLLVPAEDCAHPVVFTCPDGSQSQPLVYRRPAGSADPYAGWQLVSGDHCREDPDAFVVTLSASDLQELPIAPSGITVQPPDGWTLANLATIVQADSASQTFATTILGVGVAVEATPVSFAWDFGDGTTLVTSDPGRPWPDPTVTHTYRRAGSHLISLTTTWSGQYQVAESGEWVTIDGVATTSSSTGPITVHAPDSHLVADGYPSGTG